MCVTRWHLVGLAAEDMLLCMEEVDSNGDKATPEIFFHMSSLDPKSSVASKGSMFLAENSTDPRHIAALTWEAEHNVRWNVLTA